MRCTSAFALSSIVTISSCPRSAATPSGVTPEPGLRMLTSAPLLIIFLALAMSLRSAAMPSLSPRELGNAGFVRPWPRSIDSMPGRGMTYGSCAS